MNEKNRRDDETECNHKLGQWITKSVDLAELICLDCRKVIARSVAAPTNDLVPLVGAIMILKELSGESNKKNI